MKFDDSPFCRLAVGEPFAVVDARGRHEERVATGIGEAFAQIDLIGVDEEVLVEVADRVGFFGS